MNHLTIWLDFISKLRLKNFPPSRIRPYPGLVDLREKLGGILAALKPAILAAADRGTAPEIHQVENRLHFILPLGGEPESQAFCFSFLLDEGGWTFQHVENIFLRLDQVGPPPVSTFPDLSEAQKAWARDEIQVSEVVRLYNYLLADKGKDFALNWFKDGSRYLVGVRAWMPFLPLSTAFIYYACWDLANLHANPVTLVDLNENKAVISGALRYFEIYQRAVHLEKQIDSADYRLLFDAIWQDRAACAGWDLSIHVDGTVARLVFTKLPLPQE